MGGSDGMNGQWVGTYAGSSKGGIIVNVDERESNYQGVAYLFNDDIKLPGTAAFFTTPDKSLKFSFRTDMILAIDRPSGNVVPWQSIADRYQGVTFPKCTDVNGSLGRDSLRLSWTTDLKSRLSQDGSRILAEKGNLSEQFQFDYATTRSKGTVVVDPLAIIDPVLVGGPGGIEPGNVAIKVHIRIVETWYKSSEKACKKL